jgi:hypothetical protein
LGYISWKPRDLGISVGGIWIWWRCGNKIVKNKNECWDNKWMLKWKLFVRILSWPNLRCFYVIFLYWLKKRTKIIIQVSRSSGRSDDCSNLSNLSGNSLIGSVYVNRIEKEINSRRIITSQEFVESSYENTRIRFRRRLVAVNTTSRPSTTNVTLKPSRSVSVDCKSSNSYRASVVTSILGRLKIRAVTSLRVSLI